MGLSWTEWAIITGVVVIVLYKWSTWNFNYFSSRGVKALKPVPFFGCMGSVTLKLRSFAYLIEDFCKEFKGERFAGLYQFQTPVLTILDPELIKRITVKDFEHFTNHIQTLSERSDPLFGKNLFALRGEKWREMRATLSPAFTSSKMRNMFNFMNECGQQLGDYLQERVDKQEGGKPFVLEMKDLFTRFTNDVIATSAFGLHIDSLKDQNNGFYKMGKQVTNFAGIKSLLFMIIVAAPKLAEFLGVSVFTKEERKFFTDLVHDTITTRDKHGIVRPDMIHLLMQARRGDLKADGEEEVEETNGILKTKKLNLSEEDIAAQALIFFFAGFETASTLLSFSSIFVAMHEDVQKKLQEELDEILGDDFKVTYEKVQKMKYLDMVLSETLRLYPPTMSTDRQCTKTYTIPASGDQPGYTFKPGDRIMIPLYGLHRDPEYFPDPEKFDPERFSEENKHNINIYTYLPFGIGPRLCIGQRFALLEAKVALIHILSRFDLSVVDKTPLPLRLTSQGFAMVIEGGFWIGATPRQNIKT